MFTLEGTTTRDEVRTRLIGLCALHTLQNSCRVDGKTIADVYVRDYFKSAPMHAVRGNTNTTQFFLQLLGPTGPWKRAWEGTALLRAEVGELKVSFFISLIWHCVASFLL